MLKSRSIRLAVNLCVIGALLLPGDAFLPVFGQSAIESSCESSASNEPTCEGCGHCQVSKPGDRCGCCAKCHQELDAKDVDRTAAEGVCLCGSDSLPAVPVTPSRSTSEEVVRLLVCSSVKGSFEAAGSVSLVFSGGHSPAPLSLLPRDSQRRLCVWRI